MLIEGVVLELGEKHMSEKEQSKNTESRNEYDIARLLEYAGPGFQQSEPIVNGVSLFDYRNTDENERKISTLLSSLGIPFNIQRPKLGWTGTQIRLIVTVPRDRQRQAEAVLWAAVEQSVIDRVEGISGLISR
jgi:hypothetical protein